TIESSYIEYQLHRLTAHARIWLKREDLNHTETGVGQHGVATATVCAKFNLECIVYMESEDVCRQALNIFRMRLLGATVVSVDSGQILETHCISVGLDYPGVGPEHACLKDIGRADYVMVTDAQALNGFRKMS
ncbi:2379_t:CDS:2, partial [Ambispora gerdemannii]